MSFIWIGAGFVGGFIVIQTMTDIVERLRTWTDGVEPTAKEREAAAEIARLRAALKEAAMLVEATALYYPSIPYKPRLDACLLEVRRALETKP